jgi:hypothetical protein
MADYSKHANANARPRTRAEVARVFTECVTCGAYKVLSATEEISTKEAVRRAYVSGWQLAGVRGHKNTRCGDCRMRVWGNGSTKPYLKFANDDPRYGMYSRRRSHPRAIQRSNPLMADQPENPPLDALVATTIPVELLEGEALLAHAEAVGEHGEGWAPPDPLKRCDKCGKHAALYVDNEGDSPRYICGPCGPTVSVFRIPIRHDDLRQRAADLALEQFEKGTQS